jgi:quinol monooxygenase YgiN
METTISTASSSVTLVNVFTVEPSKQQALVDLLVESSEQMMRHEPGFISANIHQSLDGTKVVNYAQWESPAAFEAMTRNPKAAPHMKRAAELAAGFEPHLYGVVSVHHR